MLSACAISLAGCAIAPSVYTVSHRSVQDALIKATHLDQVQVTDIAVSADGSAVYVWAYLGGGVPEVWAFSRSTRVPYEVSQKQANKALLWSQEHYASQNVAGYPKPNVLFKYRGYRIVYLHKQATIIVINPAGKMILKHHEPVDPDVVMIARRPPEDEPRLYLLRSRWADDQTGMYVVYNLSTGRCEKRVKIRTPFAFGCLDPWSHYALLQEQLVLPGATAQLGFVLYNLHTGLSWPIARDGPRVLFLPDNWFVRRLNQLTRGR